MRRIQISHKVETNLFGFLIDAAKAKKRKRLTEEPQIILEKKKKKRIRRKCLDGVGLEDFAGIGQEFFRVLNL